MGWRWRYNTARAKVDWDKILEAIKERHTELEEFGVDRFTPRFVHYYLKQSRTDLGLFNVKSDKWKPYPRLIDHLTAWRKSGDLPNEWFYDDKRHDAEQMPSLTPEEYAFTKHYYVLTSARDYEIYRWFKQPVYLEVWVEKNAMFPIVKQILKGKQVTVVPCSGFISHSKLWEHTKRLKDKQDQGFKIVILYLGDLDPSGENMDIGLPNRFTQMRLGLNVWDKNKFECKRIAVKEEHVKKFGLLKLGPDPEPGDDPDTSDARAKLLRDPRREEFRRNHNGELFCVELEAMAAKGALEELAKIVKRAVDSYYDRKIWRKYKPYLAEDNAKKWLITKYEEAVEKIKEDWELDDEPPVSLEDVEGKEEQDEEEEDVDEID